MWYDVIMTSSILHLEVRLRLGSGALRGLLPLLLASPLSLQIGLHTHVTLLLRGTMALYPGLNVV